jgi:hypothetical protein
MQDYLIAHEFTFFLTKKEQVIYIYSLHETSEIILIGNWAPRREGMW